MLKDVITQFHIHYPAAMAPSLIAAKQLYVKDLCDSWYIANTYTKLLTYTVYKRLEITIYNISF